MMRYAICNETFGELDWAATCHQVAETGYDGIEIAPFTLTEDVRVVAPHARHVYANTARRAGLQVVGLHWLLVSPAGLSLTADDASVRNETADYLTALVDFCADMGGNRLVLGSPNQRRLPSDKGHRPAVEIAADRLIACLEPALQRAAKHDVTLCLEPLPAPEADFILTLAEATVILKRVAHPNLKTIFDVKSASAETSPLPPLIRHYAPAIAHVHANDTNRRAPGYGDTDFVPILAALAECKYEGFVSIEVFDNPSDPQQTAKDGLAYLKRCEAAGVAAKNNTF